MVEALILPKNQNYNRKTTSVSSTKSFVRVTTMDAPFQQQQLIQQYNRRLVGTTSSLCLSADDSNTQSPSSISEEELKRQLTLYLEKRKEANADEVAQQYVGCSFSCVCVCVCWRTGSVDIGMWNSQYVLILFLFFGTILLGDGWMDGWMDWTEKKEKWLVEHEEIRF